MYRNLVRPLSQALGRLVKFTAGLMSPNNVIWQSGRNRTSGQPLQIRVLRIMFCTQVNRCLYSCTGRSQQRQRLFGILSSRISLELHVSAIPLIFVLHFKCSVLILDKKMNFTKLWRALWPLWHCWCAHCSPGVSPILSEQLSDNRPLCRNHRTHLVFTFAKTDDFQITFQSFKRTEGLPKEIGRIFAKFFALV